MSEPRKDGTWDGLIGIASFLFGALPAIYLGGLSLLFALVSLPALVSDPDLCFAKYTLLCTAGAAGAAGLWRSIVLKTDNLTAVCLLLGLASMGIIVILTSANFSYLWAWLALVPTAVAVAHLVRIWVIRCCTSPNP